MQSSGQLAHPSPEPVSQKESPHVLHALLMHACPGGQRQSEGQPPHVSPGSQAFPSELQSLPQHEQGGPQVSPSGQWQSCPGPPQVEQFSPDGVPHCPSPQPSHRPLRGLHVSGGAQGQSAQVQFSPGEQVPSPQPVHLGGSGMVSHNCGAGQAQSSPGSPQLVMPTPGTQVSPATQQPSLHPERQSNGQVPHVSVPLQQKSPHTAVVQSAGQEHGLSPFPHTPSTAQAAQSAQVGGAVSPGSQSPLLQAGMQSEGQLIAFSPGEQQPSGQLAAQLGQLQKSWPGPHSPGASQPWQTNDGPAGTHISSGAPGQAQSGSLPQSMPPGMDATTQQPSAAARGGHSTGQPQAVSPPLQVPSPQ